MWLGGGYIQLNDSKTSRAERSRGEWYPCDTLEVLLVLVPLGMGTCG